MAVFHRTKDIGAQHKAVVHLDWNIPVDAHAVADFRSLLQRGHCCLPGIVLGHARALPGIHVFGSCYGVVDGRDKPGHNE